MNRFHVLLLALVLLIGVMLFACPAHAASQPPIITVPDVTCVENASCTLIVTKTKANSYSRIQLTSVDGTAKAGIDYRALNAIYTLSNNQTQLSVPLSLIDNSSYQGSRTFAVRITVLRFAQVAPGYVPPTVTITDDETPPLPPPPSTGVAGETPIADNFDVSQAIEQTWYGPLGRGGIAPASADPVGAFREFCAPGQILRDDPMVYAGQPGASPHLHQFFGNTGTTGNSNYNSLRTTGQSTCGNRGSSTPTNRSAYWMPAMLDGVGNVVKPDYMNLYYKRNPASDPYCKSPDLGGIGICTDLPNGIRFIFGANMKTMTDGPTDVNSQNHDAITFQCWASFDNSVSNNGLNAYYHSMEEVRAAGCPVGARLMIIAAAPNCWDGVNLDSADHRSHMTWSNGAMYPGQFFRACPLDHPYVIPNLEVQVAYTIDANFVAGKWLLDSDRQMDASGMQVVPGSTWHMDYWEAWSPTVKATWHRTCINQKLSCAGGDLGDGTDILKADHYPNTDFPTHVLVPVP
jgi:hypothetical protein